MIKERNLSLAGQGTRRKKKIIRVPEAKIDTQT
jgi:hypothetical protein